MVAWKIGTTPKINGQQQKSHEMIGGGKMQRLLSPKDNGGTVWGKMVEERLPRRKEVVGRL